MESRAGRRRWGSVAFNDDLIVQFRKNRGVITEGPFTGRDVPLLTTTGAKSGVRRTIHSSTRRTAIAT